MIFSLVQKRRNTKHRMKKVIRALVWQWIIVQHYWGIKRKIPAIILHTFCDRSRVITTVPQTAGGMASHRLGLNDMVLVFLQRSALQPFHGKGLWLIGCLVLDGHHILHNE